MAKVIHVAKAQQRYVMVPVLDPETGEPKVTPVLRADGSPKVTKRGRPVTMRVTVADKSQPLAPLRCGACGQPIEVGTPYKHVTTKATYGGVRRNRHEGCPGWEPWDLSDAWWARIAQAQDVEYDETDAQSVADACRQVAESANDLAEQSREAASNIEDGFGHSTSQSEEAEERADALEGWASELEECADALEALDEEPEAPVREDGESDEDFEGRVENYESAKSEWENERDNAISEATDKINESPV